MVAGWLRGRHPKNALWMMGLHCANDFGPRSDLWTFTTADAPVAAQSSTWGRIKSLYRDCVRGDKCSCSGNRTLQPQRAITTLRVAVSRPAVTRTKYTPLPTTKSDLHIEGVTALPRVENCPRCCARRAKPATSEEPWLTRSDRKAQRITPPIAAAFRAARRSRRRCDFAPPFICSSLNGSGNACNVTANGSGQIYLMTNIQDFSGVTYTIAVTATLKR